MRLKKVGFDGIFKIIFLLISIQFITVFSNVYAQETFPLWEGKAPGSETWQHEEVSTTSPNGRTIVHNVVDPSLSVYLPDPSIANGVAVIVSPGGGFRILSMNEGIDTARWLTERGFTAFVLKYRLLKADGPPQMPALSELKLEFKNANANPDPDNTKLNEVIRLATLDGQQAIRMVRENAEKWNIDPEKIGIMGFSAGGGVAVGSALLGDTAAYPNFVVSLYGPSMVDVVVPENAAPLFIAVAANHKPVSEGCIALYSVWNAAGKSAELHIYSQGGGPFGIKPRGLPSDTWAERFVEWIKGEGIIN
ncbi:alpha/beta hydrolase [Aurantivibrio infirmus]